MARLRGNWGDLGASWAFWRRKYIIKFLAATETSAEAQSKIFVEKYEEEKNALSNLLIIQNIKRGVV